jgi:hypothetical protein
MLKTLQSAPVEYINSYDFTSIVSHAVQKNPQLNLIEKIDSVLTEYKNFMLDCSTTTTPINVPNEEVDAIWHSHILFSKKYFEFCKQIAGRYIHHTPHTGCQADCVTMPPVKASNCSGGTNCSGTGCWGSCRGN